MSTATATAEAPVNAPEGPRSEKELLIATRAFTEEDRTRGWAATLSSLALLGGLTAGAMFSPWWPLRLAFALVAGLTIVRVFCLFHDFQHGAILRQSKLAQVLFGFFGTSILVPPSVWRETHNYHHAHTAKMVGSHIGSYPMVTTAMGKDLSPAQKLGYRLARHPLTMLLRRLHRLHLGMCRAAVPARARKHWARRWWAW